MEVIKTLLMLALTIAVFYGLGHSIKTRQKNELETSNEYLYIDGKRMCRGILHFSGRLYSFECVNGTTYRGLQNFVVR